MATLYDTSGIQSAVYQGVGMGILAGISMKTMQMMERGLYGDNERRRRAPPKKKEKPYKPKHGPYSRDRQSFYTKPYRPRAGPYSWGPRW